MNILLANPNTTVAVTEDSFRKSAVKPMVGVPATLVRLFGG
jgi:hypothetical protein